MSNNDSPVILVVGGAGGIGSAVARRLSGGLHQVLDREQGWVTGQVIGVDGGLGHIQARS